MNRNDLTSCQSAEMPGARIASASAQQRLGPAGRSSQGVEVKLRGITKRFGAVTAVDDLTLDISDGEFFSLLGPSGCGKTTTLRLLGGFEEPTSGTILFGDDNVTHRPPYRRDVNTVFQNYALFPRMTVFDNIAFGLRRRGVAGADIRRRVNEMLQLVDLAGYERRRPAQLSGGQQQRTALARALVNQPRLLLLDEPMGALDAKLRKHMQQELKRIQQQVGVTFLYVTHDQEEAMSMSDRLAVMRGGRIEDIGAPERVYDNPATEFVADFLGTSNLLNGHVSERQAGYTIVKLDDGTLLKVPDDRVQGRFTDGTMMVRVGVRPEKLRLLPASQVVDPSLNVVRGIITLITYLGVSRQYQVDRGNDGPMIAHVQSLDAAPSPQNGEAVQLAWSPEHTFTVNSQADPAAVISGSLANVSESGSPRP